MKTFNRYLATILPALFSLSLLVVPVLHAEDAASTPDAALKANASPDTSTPQACVESLHNVLLETMKTGDETSCAERYKRLEPVLGQLFDFTLTSRLALGRNWKKLTPEKQQQFVRAFAAMSIATYAERFDGFNNEKFKTVETKELRPDRKVVRTVLITSKGEEIPLDYTCVLSDKSWRIVTVTAKGVNDLAMKRSEYTSFLKEKPIDDLIAFLMEQANKCDSSDAGK